MTNEQKFTNAEERNAAYRAYITDFTRPIIGQFEWLALEAEEEKPEPCPFCGGECRTVVNQYEDHVVGCDNCCYCSREFNSDSEAIAAHNRVARAVMAAKEETK